MTEATSGETIPNSPEQNVAFLITQWSECRQDNPELTGLQLAERRLKVLAGAGYLAIRAWSKEFEKENERTPSASLRTRRRDEVCRGETAQEYIGLGVGVFETYVEKVHPANGHLLDHQSKLDKTIRSLAKDARESLDTIHQTLIAHRESLEKALPDGEAAKLVRTVEALSVEIQTMRTQAPAKAQAKPWAWVLKCLKWVALEPIKIVLGVALAAILIKIAPFGKKAIEIVWPAVQSEAAKFDDKTNSARSNTESAPRSPVQDKPKGG